MAKKQAYQTLLNPLGNQTQELDVSMFDKKDELDLSMFQEPSKKKEDSESTSEVQASSSKELVGVPETPTQQDGFRTVQPHRLEPAVQYNQQVKKTREELQSMIPQIEQTIADIDKKAAINIGDNVAIYGFGKKQGDLLTARRYLQKTAKVLKSPDEEGFKAFMSGLRRNDLANLLSLGYTDAYKALKTTQIAKKVSEGEEPTEEEYLLLTGRYLLDLADSNKKRTSSYNIGNALAEMAPFLGQIYLTSPIGEAATTAATAATKKAMTKGAVDVLRKYGLTDLLKTATTAAAQSPFTGMFMQKYADNRMPQMDMDENGKIVPVQGTGETVVDAATEALGSTFSSIFSEKMGEFIKGRVSASGKGLAATLQEPGKALKSIQSLRRDLNWSGMGYEFLEEQIDGVGQALLTDDAKLNDLFDAKKQFETLATIMLAGGAMKALEIPGYFKEKGYKKDLEKATDIFEKTVDEPSRKAVKAAINTDNVEEMQNRLSSEDFSHLTPEQGKTVLDYMKAKISYNSLFEAANTKLETTEKKATVPQNNVTVAEKTPETIQSTTQEEMPVHERYYQESMAKKQPDVVEKMPVFKNKKFSIATILPNGDISNVYVRSEGDSHKTYMSPEDAQAYEDGRMTIGFWSPTSNTFMEAPQKGKEFGQRVMEIAASKIEPPTIQTEQNIGEPSNAERIGTETETIRSQEEMVEEEKERLRVRDNAENGMEAPEGATEQVAESRDEVRPEKGIIFKDKNYQDEVQIKESLAVGEITAPEYNQAVGMLNKRNFEDSKERLRQNLEGLFTKQAIGDEATKLTDVYDSLVDFIKNAIAVYGDKIKSGRDVAKLTGIKYNNLVKDAYLEASGQNVTEPGRKMLGFPKRIKEFREFQDMKVDIENNPELMYDPQKLSEAHKEVRDMTAEELIAASSAQGAEQFTENPLRTLAYWERINRMRAAGESTKPLIEELSKNLKMWGQLIRQAGEIKGTIPENVLQTFEDMLEKQGRFLTEGQKEKLLGLITDKIDTHQAWKDQAELTRILPTDENIKKFHSSEEARDKAQVEMMKYIQDMTPRKFWGIISQALQGNLLTVKSLLVNVLGNIGNIPISSVGKTIAFPVDAVWSYVFNTPRTIIIDPRANIAGWKGAWVGTKKAVRQIRTGVDPASKAEIQMGFRPLRAWAQAFSKESEELLPRTKEGKVSMKDRVNKIAEGFFGMEAEPMFRGLALGDKPFYHRVEAMTLYRLGKLKGLKGKDLETFTQFPPKWAEEEAVREAKEATFQEDSGASRVALSISRTIDNVFPSSGFWGFLTRTIKPYVKTPANIISQTFDMAIPPLAMAKAANDLRLGRQRQGMENIGKAGVGLMLWAAARTLLESGLMSGSPDKEKKIRDAERAVMPPNSINISGLRRKMNGGDPSYMDGDDVISYTKLGIPGMVMGIHANVYDQKEQLMKQVADDEDAKAAWTLLSSAMVIPTYALEQSFLQGTSALITAISEGQYENWLNTWFKAVASVPLPNTLDQLNRVSREYIPEIRGDSTWERFGNVIRNKLWMTDDLPVKTDLWGEPIKQTPEGSNPWIYQMFNAANLQELSIKPETKIMYDLYVRTENADVIPPVPTRKITVNNSAYELNSEQYARYIELVGKQRLKEFKSLQKMGSFQKGTDESKLKQLEYTWGKGRDKAKSQFLKEYPTTQLRKIKK